MAEQKISPTARPFRFAPPCAECGQEGATLEVIAPGGLPQRWSNWGEHDRAIHLKYTDQTRWRMLYHGIVGGSGAVGDPITEEGAIRLLAMVSPEPQIFTLQKHYYDNLGYCVTCRTPYCMTCWSVSGGVGWCPRGHDDVLDPW